MTYEPLSVSAHKLKSINSLAEQTGRSPQKVFTEAIEEGLNLFRETPCTSSEDEEAQHQGTAQ